MRKYSSGNSFFGAITESNTFFSVSKSDYTGVYEQRRMKKDDWRFLSSSLNY